jgi:hypothetical protein
MTSRQMGFSIATGSRGLAMRVGWMADRSRDHEKGCLNVLYTPTFPALTVGPSTRSTERADGGR